MIIDVGTQFTRVPSIITDRDHLHPHDNSSWGDECNGHFHYRYLLYHLTPCTLQIHKFEHKEISRISGEEEIMKSSRPTAHQRLKCVLTGKNESV